MLKAGIIGLGVGESHIAGYQAHRQCRVTALCDLSEEKCLEARRKYPDMLITPDPAEIISDPGIDVVSVASYDDCHCGQIIAALDAGKHVFVEKPLCLFASEARDIRRALDRNPHLKISSNLILRRTPRFIDLKRSIAKGEMGEIFHVEGDYDYGRLQKITEGWRGRIDFYSVMLGGGIHMIDLLMWLTGDPVVEVAAFGNAICSRGSAFRYDDMVAGILKFKSGLTGKVAANFGCVRPHFHGLSVYGTKATFINGRPDATLFTSRDPADEPVKIRTPYPGTRKGDMIGSFVDAILGRGEPEVTGEDIFRAISVCFALEEAARTSSVVPVEYL